MSDVQVFLAGAAEKEILNNLMKFYQYDFTEFGGDEVNKQGTFDYPYFELYWQESNRDPYLIKYKENIAGFCFVNDVSLTGAKNCKSIAEFFILRYLRHKGIASAAAKGIISLYPSCLWEISQTYKNIYAQKFWLQFVSSFSNDNFKKMKNDETQKIILQFHS